MSGLSTIRRLYFEGNRREATRLAREAVRVAPTGALFHALGLLELSGGNHQAAQEAFSRALSEGTGEDWAIRNDLGTSLAQEGKFEAALLQFSQVPESAAIFAAAEANRGAALLRLGDFAGARAAFERSLARDPQPGTALGLARALGRSGHQEQASVIVDRILSSTSLGFEALDALLELQLGTLTTRLRWAREKLESQPRHMGIRALFLRAWAEVDASAADEEFSQVHALTQVIPATQKSAEEYAGWAALIGDHPSFCRAPAQHATVGGSHSGDLLFDPDINTSGVRDEIARCVTRYVRSIEGASDVPDWWVSTPFEVHLHAWAVALDSGQYQEVHFHPDAWISGCFYLQVPDSVARGGAGGQLYFRAPSGRDVGHIVPRVGQMVLFPSCLDHGTVAQSASGRRLSVAFDVIARAGQRH